LPVGDLPGWRQIFTEDFGTNVGLGSFPGSSYRSKWSVYLDGWPDTAAQSENANSGYYPSRVVSVENGILSKHLHVENGVAMSAAIYPTIGYQTYGRYSVRFRADPIPGFKVAWLLWPESDDNLRDGEIDFPEGDLNDTIYGFMHHTGAAATSDQDYVQTGATFSGWHTATVEWSPGRVTYILDGAVHKTVTTRVPSTPMEWVLQTESCLGHCQPGASVSGNVQIDWVAAWSYAG
jgi:beta-glucanase (GH16 family)